MTRGKPNSGKRTIDPANKPGPDPMDDQERRRHSIYCSRDELASLRAYLAQLRAANAAAADKTGQGEGDEKA